MDYRFYDPTRQERTLWFLGFALLSAGAGYLFYGSLLTGLAVPLFYRKAEKRICSYLAERRRTAMLLQFRDFLYSLSASFATGRPMQSAMEEASAVLTEIYGPGSCLGEEIDYMLRKIRETGDTDRAVLDDFARRSALPDVEDFAQVYSACRETGGNLIFAVNKAAGLIGEKITIEREIQVMAAQKRLEGRIIALMPPVVILFLRLTSPDYLQVMYTTTAGRMLMTLALAAGIGAFVMIERMTNIEI